MMRGGNNQADDLSSQGSYMVKRGAGPEIENQSEGSYMVQGFHGQNVNFDDDKSDEDSFVRQSQSSFVQVASDAKVDKFSEKSEGDEFEDTTAKFTS